MIYFLEDDENIRKFVLYALNSVGYEAKGYEKPSELRSAMQENIPDLLLLDIMLPEEDGISVLKKIRNKRETENLPVIMLTAKDSEYDKVLGLDSGADDYISKPFGTMELISRVKALLRRTNDKRPNDENEYKIDGLFISPSKHSVTVNGESINLTLKEFELLVLMAKNPGRVFTREQIFQDIWGYDFDGENRTLDVHIRTLRVKLGDAGKLIETVRGIGYKIGG